MKNLRIVLLLILIFFLVGCAVDGGVGAGGYVWAPYSTGANNTIAITNGTNGKVLLKSTKGESAVLGVGETQHFFYRPPVRYYGGSHYNNGRYEVSFSAATLDSHGALTGAVDTETFRLSRRAGQHTDDWVIRNLRQPR